MSSLSNRKVKQFRVHQSTHVAGIGNLTPLIVESSGGNAGKLEMTLLDNGVLCKTKKIEFFIPATNIISVELYSEENSKTVKSAG